jgi:hypothetical protein
MRIQPNPSLDTKGPFLPSAIFVIVVIVVILVILSITDTKISRSGSWPMSLMAQFTCLGGSMVQAVRHVLVPGSVKGRSITDLQKMPYSEIAKLYNITD